MHIHVQMYIHNERHTRTFLDNAFFIAVFVMLFVQYPKQNDFQSLQF